MKTQEAVRFAVSNELGRTEAAVPRFPAEVALTYAAIGPREAARAAAYAAFGRGRHPAALNRGDGFAYACAKASNAA